MIYQAGCQSLQVPDPSADLAFPLYLFYRTLALYLAKQVFVVACPEHPHNNRSDNIWEASLNNPEYRPRASMAMPGFAPAQDPPGFARGDFLTRLNQTITEFFRHHLCT